MDTLGRADPTTRYYAQPTLSISGSKPYLPHKRTHVPETLEPWSTTLTPGESLLHPADDASFIHLKYSLYIHQAEASISTYIPHSAFLRFLPSSISSPSPPPSNDAIIPWAQWAAPYVRLAPFSDYTAIATETFGSRRAYWQREGSMLTVADFLSDKLEASGYPSVEGEERRKNKIEGISSVTGAEWSFTNAGTRPQLELPALARQDASSENKPKASHCHRRTYTAKRALESIKRHERFVGEILMDSRRIVICTVRPFSVASCLRKSGNSN